jgi:hypothetical protein
MSDTYIHYDTRGHHYDSYNHANNSHFHHLRQTNAILMNWLIGSMTVLIVTYTLILCYYFKLLQTICKRALRKHGKMITLGELRATTPPTTHPHSNSNSKNNLTPLSNEIQV